MGYYTNFTLNCYDNCSSSFDISSKTESGRALTAALHEINPGYFDDDFDKYDIHNEKHSPVCQFDLNGNFIKEYNTIHNASCCTNISTGNIISCCNNYTKKAGGFIWRYKGE